MSENDEIQKSADQSQALVSLKPCPFCGATEQTINGKVFSLFEHTDDCWLLRHVNAQGNSTRVWFDEATEWNQRH